MADIIIPDVPDDVIAAVDVRACGWVCHKTASCAACWSAAASSRPAPDRSVISPPWSPSMTHAPTTTRVAAALQPVSLE